MYKRIKALLEQGVDEILSEARKLAEKPWGPKIIYSPDEPGVEEKIKEISKLLIKACEIEMYIDNHIDNHKKTKRKYKGTVLTFGTRIKGTGNTVESMMASDIVGIPSFDMVQWHVDKRTDPSNPRVLLVRMINGKRDKPVTVDVC